MSKKNEITSNNDLFIRRTVTKLKEHLDKFIMNTNYTDAYSLFLKQRLDNFQDKLDKQRERAKTQKLMQNQPISSFLPQIAKMSHPNYIQDPSDIYQPKQNTRNKKWFTEASARKTTTITTSMKTKLKNLRIYNEPKKQKYQIDKMCQTSPTEHLSKSNYLKYSIENTMKNFHNKVIFDSSCYPIIRSKEVKKGLFDMVNKGLIPKEADLTPALNYNGNPFNVSNDHTVKDNYKKKKFRDEIYDERKMSTMNNITTDIKEKISQLDSEINNTDQQRTFITTTNADNKENDNKSIDVIITDIKLTDNNKNSIESKEENKLTDKILTISTIPKTEIIEKEIPLLIEFIEFNAIQNDNIDRIVKEQCIEKKKIDVIVNNMCTLFKKLHLRKLRCDANLIIDLIKNKKGFENKISNKDLLLCILKEDLNKYGLDPLNEYQFLQSVKNAFALTIQNKVRQLQSKKKLDTLRIEYKTIIYIQNWYRNCSYKNKFKNELKVLKEQREKVYNEMMRDFKENWSEISEMTRIEIHINSLSYPNEKLITVDKFKEKENLQLNRLIRLIDSNIEIIYISSYEISEQILTYYFSILKSLGVKKPEGRFHLIVPEFASILPPRYSLSQLLFLSQKSQQKIQNIIYERNCYIVPGVSSKLEEEIGYILYCPVLMGNTSQIDLICNKSGAKGVFDVNDIAFPISAWEIKTEEEFYSSLAYLIATYPKINIWLFKINNESNGRGIAYLNISDIDYIQMLKIEKSESPNFTDELYQEKIYHIIRSVINKKVNIAYPSLYPNWNEYLNKFTKEKGIIESCPTFDLNGIMGSPAVPIFIEPNGKIKVLPTYDKINTNYFMNILCTSPQKSLIDVNMNIIGEKIGSFLYSQNIIGYVTIEFITFHDGKKILFWGIDLKYGLTDEISSLQFCYFLYIQSVIIQREEEDEFIFKQEQNYSKIIQDAIAFTIPRISDRGIREVMFKDFLQAYRFEFLVFDMKKSEGIIFSFPDTLEGAIFGVCGVVNLNKGQRIKGDIRMWEMIKESIKIMNELIKKNKGKNKFRINTIKSRSDAIRIEDIKSKIKLIWKQKSRLIDKEKKEFNIMLQKTL